MARKIALIDEMNLVREPTILHARYISQAGQEDLFPPECIKEVLRLGNSNKKFKNWILTRDLSNIPRKLIYRCITLGVKSKSLAAYSSGNLASYMKYVNRYYS